MTTTVCAMDELLVEFLSRDPRQKFTQPGEFIGPFPSGAPAIFTTQMVKLSHRAIFFECAGNDNLTRLTIERFRHEGVITDGIHVINNAVTDTAFMSYQNPQQRNFIFNIPNSTCGLFTAKHIDKNLLEQYNHLHIVGSSLFSFHMVDIICKTITTIKSAGGTVSFDPNICKEMLSIPEIAQALGYLIEYADIFISSESRLLFFACHKDLSKERIVSDLLHGGVKHVAIRHTQCRASHYKLKNGTLHAQHVIDYDIEIIDPADTGDCFGTTFIILFLSGFPAHKALQYTNADDALTVMRQGPMEGISSLTNTKGFLQQH